MPFKDDIRSVTVPGCVDGWLALHERFGALPVSEVLRPALGYATNGFPASPTLAQSIFQVAHLPEAADYTSHGPVRPGTMIRRPGVARALLSIMDGGRQAFYEGEFGSGLLELGAGEFVPDDLARPLADWVPALDAPAWGRRVWTVPPNSQGYLTLAAAAIASELDLPTDPDDPQWAHLLVETWRARHHRPRAVVRIPVPGRLSAALRSGANTAPGRADSRQTWGQFVHAQTNHTPQGAGR